MKIRAHVFLLLIAAVSREGSGESTDKCESQTTSCSEQRQEQLLKELMDEVRELRGGQFDDTKPSNECVYCCSETKQEHLLTEILDKVNQMGKRILLGRRTEGVFALKNIEEYEYLLSLNPDDWYTAHDLCNEYGYSMASIESEIEQASIEEWLSLLPGLNGSKSNSVSIDGFYKNQIWWMPTTESAKPLDYQNWKPGQPDHRDDKGYYSEEQCVAMSAENDFKWNDEGCESDNFYLCKRHKREDA